MPKYIPVADKIADGLFAAKNRMFDFVQQRLNEGKSEKEIMKKLKETVTADPSMLAEIEHTFFKKKAKAVEKQSIIDNSDFTTDITIVKTRNHFIQHPTKSAKFNPYRTKKDASWIDDAKVGDQVELNNEMGEVTYIDNDKIEVKTPTKTETIWKN